MAISLLVYVTIFSGQLYFRRSYFSTFLRSNYFDATVIFQSSYFFKAAAFLRSSFFRTVTEYLLLQNETSTGKRKFLRKRNCLGQLLSGTATFLPEELFRIKISTVELLFWSRYFCTASTFSEELHFGKS